MKYLAAACASFIGLMTYMIKQSYENNLLNHHVSLNGKNEQVTLFFISDVHLRKISEKMIRQIDKKVHAVIIGGDFADKRTPIDRICENIHLLKTLGPVYFVWGNNDREVGEQNIRQIFHETGVTIIENNAIRLTTTQNALWLSAVDDTSTKNARIDKALEECRNDHDPVVFISHNPLIFSKVRKYFDVHLMLGGHLHGGQIRFGPFGIHPHGSFTMRDGVPTLISNGYGTTMLPMRLGAKPQCHIIDLNFNN